MEQLIQWHISIISFTIGIIIKQKNAAIALRIGINITFLVYVFSELVSEYKRLYNNSFKLLL